MNTRAPSQHQQQEHADPGPEQASICRLEWISRAIAAARDYPERETQEPEPPSADLRVVE